MAAMAALCRRLRALGRGVRGLQVRRRRGLNDSLSRRQGRRLTELRRIHGDIWALERDLRAFLGSLGLPELRAQVNEVTGTLRLRGHCGLEVRQWLLRSGF